MKSNHNVRETNTRLLADAQAYLKLRHDNKASPSVLTMAWEDFYRVYDVLIRRFIISQGVPSPDVDDCQQEVWSAVVSRLTHFIRPLNRPGLRSWLYALVRHKAADLIRARFRHRARSFDQIVGSTSEPVQPEADPAALCETKWEVEALTCAIESLRGDISDINYRILHLRLMEGRPGEQVAALLQLTPEQVRFRYHRAMRKVRAQLTTPGDTKASH